MEQIVTRFTGRVERILRAHECFTCIKDDAVCRDLAIVLWNIVAVEIVSAVGLENLKHELLEGVCEVVDRNEAMVETDVDHLDTCNLIKIVARKSIRNYYSECARLIQDAEGGSGSVGTDHPQLSLIDKVTRMLDMFFSSEISKGLGYFIEPMICPLARICLERQNCLLELRTGTLLFQYLVRHMGQFAFKYHDFLGPFILKFLQRQDYKNLVFRLGYSDVVDLMVVILEFAKDMFEESSTALPGFDDDGFYSRCWCLLSPQENIRKYDPHFESKIYGRRKIVKFRDDRMTWADPASPVAFGDMDSSTFVKMLLEPLRFENFYRMQFIYDTFLEQVEDDYVKGRFWWDFTRERIWHAFRGYFQQRKQKGVQYKSLKSRLIRALGGYDEVRDLKRKYRFFSAQPRFWIGYRLTLPWIVLPPVEASTQVEDTDITVSS